MNIRIIRGKSFERGTCRVATGKERLLNCGQKCFLSAGYKVFQPFQSSKKIKFLIRREFITTETELSAIAAAASIGYKAWKLKNEHRALMNCCQKKKLKDKAPFQYINFFCNTIIDCCRNHWRAPIQSISESLTSHFCQDAHLNSSSDSSQSDNQNEVNFCVVLDQRNMKHFNKP